MSSQKRDGERDGGSAGSARLGGRTSPAGGDPAFSPGLFQASGLAKQMTLNYCFTIHVPTSRLQRLMQTFSPDILRSSSHQLAVSSTSDHKDQLSEASSHVSVVDAVVELMLLMLLWARWDRFSIPARAITFPLPAARSS